MPKSSPITEEIQRLRVQLDALLKDGRDIRDSEVIAISHRMDRLVLQYYDDADRLAEGG